MFDIFKSFSKEELAFFREFLKTNYFNGSQILQKLFENLLNYPNFDKKKVIENVVNNKTILGKQMNEHMVTEYYYKLIKKAQEFLSFRRFYNDAYIKNEMLLDELDERNFEKSFIKLFREMHHKVNKENDSTLKYFRLYHLNEKFFNFTERNNNIIKHKKTYDRLDLINMCNEYKKFYCFTECISIFIVYTINKYSYNIDSSDKSVSSNFDWIQELYFSFKDVFSHPLIDLYYKLYMTFYSLSDLSNYKNYKEYFNQVKSKIHIEEAKHHFQFLIKYCTLKKSLSEDKDFYKAELIDLYKLFLENKFYQVDGEKYIQTRLVINIIKMFKSIGDMSWIAEFIKKNSEILNPKEKNIVKYFLNTYQLFLSKNYKAALNEINKIDIHHYSFKIDIQTLKVRILYNLGEEYIESARSYLLSFKIFIRKDKFMSHEMKKGILKFLNYLDKLIKLDNQKKLRETYHQLERDTVHFKDWLLTEYEKELR